MFAFVPSLPVPLKMIVIAMPVVCPLLNVLLQYYTMMIIVIYYYCFVPFCLACCDGGGDDGRETVYLFGFTLKLKQVILGAK